MEGKVEMHPVVGFLLHQTEPIMLEETLQDAVWHLPPISTRCYERVWLDQINGAVLVRYTPGVHSVSVYGFDLLGTHAFRCFEPALDIPPSIEIRGHMPETHPRPRRDPRLPHRLHTYVRRPAHERRPEARHGLPETAWVPIELVMLVPAYYPLYFTSGNYVVARIGPRGEISHRHAAISYLN